MLSPKQQAFELFNKSRRVLIVLPRDYSIDALCSGLALLALGQQLDKKVELAAQGTIPEKLSFLPHLDQIKQEPDVLRDFIISIDTSKNKISQLRYETTESVLKIFLDSRGKIEQKDIKLEPGPFNYELIITVDAPDLETIGQFYEKYTELFFEKPILNIDTHSGNEHYGEANLVEPKASSSAEILADFLNSFFPNNITPPLATCLLTGIIAKTNSFQKINTSPQTFNLASFLVTQGAEKEKVIQSLYKTKPLNYLKLWGRFLSRLEWEKEENIAWLEAKTEDFEETGVSPESLSSVSEEIYDILPQLNASIIFYSEKPNLIHALVFSPKPDLLQKLNLELGGSIKNSQMSYKLVNTDINSEKNKLQHLLNSFL